MYHSLDLIPKSLIHYHDKKMVCHFLRISTSTLNRWIRHGKFPQPLKIGNNIIGWPTETIRRVI